MQYKAPLYRVLADDPRLEILVTYCSRRGAAAGLDPDMGVTMSWDIDLLSGYPHVFLRNLSPTGRGFLRHLNPGIVIRLLRRRWDGVLFHTGWGSATAWIAMAACLMTRTPILMFGDSCMVPPENGLRGRLRALVLRTLFRGISRFMTIGTCNRTYYLHYGAEPERMIPFPYAIDNERFMRQSRLTDEERRDVRRRYGIGPEELVILFAGKLIPRKGPEDLLEAFIALESGRSPGEKLRLVFAGDGELRQRLEARAGDRAVTFTGFVNQGELPALYGSADLFVLPSHDEPWGLVVNEAMASGLPILVSSAAGSGLDLVEEGVNGYRFSAGDVARLRELLAEVASDRSRLSEIGERSRTRIASWSYQHDADALVEALQRVRK
ncbi:MAG: glycosyltransferase family 4 protein [Acidobacteria bacterium]|nr:glycosyltransferase family 4 protein [Acidobacteriota bacterium]